MTETPDAEITAFLTELLKRAAAAHGVYEKAELGGKYDDDWPQWYAAHMAHALAEAGYRITREPGHQPG